MRIDRVELFHVRMPLIAPWRTAYGQDDAIHSVLCRISSGSLSAWGESTPLAAPCYSAEWAGGVFEVARQWLGPHLLGKQISSAEALQRELVLFKGNPFAKALLDTAWWALESRRTLAPLHQLLGARQTRVAVGADFGVEERIEDLLEKIHAAVEQGFPRVKLKFKPGWDLPMVAAVRKAFPDLKLHIDCNSGYTLADAALFEALDDFNLAMIEQPLEHDDLFDHAQLQRRIRTPICLDESICSVERARQAIALGSARIINIKPGRLGGLTPARQVQRLCREHGIGSWVGGMLESALGASQCLALALLEHTYPPDLFPSGRFYAEDLSDPPMTLVRLPGGEPGIEVPDAQAWPEPVPERLQRCTLQHAVLGR